jgi:ankyrin repeat protein
MSEKPNRLQNWADTLTFVCIISLGILIFLWANRPSGMEALGLIFPLLVVGLLHLTLGLLAILAALLTGRFWRNSWIYGYFALLLLCLLAYLGPMQVGQELVRGRIERMTHPAETRLYAAIESASLSDVEEALTEGADPSYCYAWDREYRGRSPLQQALTHRRADLVSRLLAAGADPNLACNPDKGSHPVVLAAAGLDEESLTALLESGADTNPPGPDRSVLVTAIAGGHYSLPYGAGDAARRRAARDPEKIRSVVATLVASGADVNAMPAKAAPLHWALAMGDGRLVHMLLRAGANPNLPEAQHGRAPLTLALAFGHVDLARRLISNDPGAQFDGVHGLGALHAAAKRRDADGVELLLAAGLDLGPILDQELSYPGGRPVDIPEELIEALQAGDDLLLNALLRAGADINQPNRRRLGQVLTGLVAYDPELLDKAIALGGDVNARNTQGGTSLHYLAGCRNCADPVPAMRHLIERGADVEALDASGKTPLEIARLRRVPDTEAFLVSVTPGEGQD